MAVEDPPSTTSRLIEFLQSAEERRDAPAFVTAALGLIASVLVAVSTATAIEAGYPAIGLGFLAAVVLFLTTLLVFEAGRRIGADG